MKARPAKKKPLTRGAPVVDGVLRATIEALAEGGYGALTIDEVASRAQVNKTTIYRRWPTKADLVRAALKLMAQSKLQFEETGSLRGDLLALGRRMIIAASSPIGCSMIRMLVGDGEQPELLEIMLSLRADHEQVPRRLMEQAIARGELAADIDPLMLPGTMIGTIHHMIFMRRETIGEEFLEKLVDLLLQGALPRAAPSKPKSPARQPKAKPKTK